MKNIKLFISLFILLVGCSEPEPINIKLLKQVDGIYYNSDNKPYSGEVFRTYSDNSGDILSSGILEDGYPLTYIEPVNTEQLNYRDDGVFLINTSTPFSGSYFINIGGNIIEEGAYLNGKLHGKLVGYYPSGQVEYIGLATDGQVNSTSSFHENGQFSSQIEYINNEPVSETYYYDNGQLKEKKSLSSEKLNGPYLSYYENGQLKKEITYDNDSMKSHIYYFRNGKIERKGTSDCDYRIYSYDLVDGAITTDLTYKDCKKFNGFMTTIYGSNIYENKYKRFYENGVQVKEEYELFDTDLQYLKTKGTNLLGEREGLWESYFSDGSIEEQKNYKEGKLHGSVKVFHYNGQLKIDANYRFGNLHGLWKDYVIDGNLNSEIEYVDGYKNGISNFYNNGKILLESNFLRDELNGLYREYDKYGTIIEEYQYSNGLKNGPSKEITVFGDVEIGNYVNDLKEGLFKIYRKDGTLQQERNYKDDRMHGEIISYDENGKVITRITYRNGKPLRDSLKLK